MQFQLFHDVDSAVAKTQGPHAVELFAVLTRFRDAIRDAAYDWSAFHVMQEYANVCFWTIRKLEYSFAAEAFGAIQTRASGPLRILDVGCGVVPFCNWMSSRGHDVVAIDPDEEIIDTLIRKNLNTFYGTSVTYQVGHSEQLDFPDAAFDVVTCVSVLEHIPPGNDRLALWEMARVLKPGGQLILTTDVCPLEVPEPDAKPWPAHLRRYAEPFTRLSLPRLLDAAMRGYADVRGAEPPELESLTWEDVHAFWRAAQAIDEREETEREYLAIGGVLERLPTPEELSAVDAPAAYLEGQAALHERLGYFEGRAQERMKLANHLGELADALRAQVADKEQEIEELDATARNRAEILVEKELEISDLDTTARARAELLLEKEQVITDLVAAAQAREDLAAEKEAQLQALDPAARERLEVAAQVERELGEQHSGDQLLTNIVVRLELLQRHVDRLLEAPGSSTGGANSHVTDAVVTEAQPSGVPDAAFAIDDALRHRGLRYRINNFFEPRIGVLAHYHGRELVIPPWYAATPVPAAAPTISIVTPSYNQGRFIERTLKSVLDQGYPRLEYVVQDGLSTDDTFEILKAYRPRLAHVESVKDAGLANGLNKGFQHATGEILAYLNSDDMLLPGALNFVGTYFENNPDVDVVYGHRILVDEDDAEIGRWVLPRHDDKVLSWADYVPQESMFWRRRIWDKIGGNIDETLDFAIDWDLLLRFREAGARMVRLPRFLGAFRVHYNQKTLRDMSGVGVKEMERLRLRALGRVVSKDEIGHALAPYLRRHFFIHKLYRMGVLHY